MPMKWSQGIGLALTALLCGCGSSGTHTGSALNDADVRQADATVPDAGAGASETEAGAGDWGNTELPPTASLFHLIDDMDHADPRLPQVPPGSSAFFWDGGTSFLGNWFVSSPVRLRDAGFDDIVPPRGNSKKACHVGGSALDGGVDLWAQLDHPGNRPVDLSAYAGVAFWARLDSPSGRFSVGFNAHKPDPTLGAVNNLPGPSLARRLGPDWERLILLFDDFAPALDRSSVVSIDFIVGGAGEPFDLWIDDLMLLCRGICP